MGKRFCLTVLLALLGCGSRTGIRSGVDGSIEVASPTGASTGDSGGTATEVGGPSVGPDTAVMVFPDTGPDRPSDQAFSSRETGHPIDQALSSEDTGRPFDQAVPSDRSPDRLDLRADGQTDPSQTPRGNYELLDDSPRTPAPDAGQCVRGFIRAYAFEFPTGAQTVEVIPVSDMMSFPMDGTLSDGSGPDLHYELKNPTGQLAGELLVWRQDNTWFAQVTVYGSRPDSGCASGELLLRY